MTELQVQARALGDPTRYAIYRCVADAEQPVGVAALTSRFGFNHNAIRQHLGKLVEAGLVEELSVKTGGPGRPRLTYRARPEADDRWGRVGPYERLAGLLLEVIATGDRPVEVGRRFGRSLGGAAASPADALREIADVMASQGFGPEVRTTKVRAEVVLHRCPFEASAVAAPEIVCELHRGLAEGLAEQSTMVSLDELVAKDPRRARCRLRFGLHRAG